MACYSDNKHMLVDFHSNGSRLAEMLIGVIGNMHSSHYYNYDQQLDWFLGYAKKVQAGTLKGESWLTA